MESAASFMHETMRSRLIKRTWTLPVNSHRTMPKVPGRFQRMPDVCLRRRIGRSQIAIVWSVPMTSKAPPANKLLVDWSFAVWMSGSPRSPITNSSAEFNSLRFLAARGRGRHNVWPWNGKEINCQGGALWTSVDCQQVITSQLLSVFNLSAFYLPIFAMDRSLILADNLLPMECMKCGLRKDKVQCDICKNWIHRTCGTGAFIVLLTWNRLLIILSTTSVLL